MKEDFLHYLWKFQKFSTGNLHTVEGEPLRILDTGVHNFNEGPDFQMAQVEIDNQKWAGNVEIHINSSDWFAHGHEKDTNYDNVILHVVWEHDAKVPRKDASFIPTIELKDKICLDTIQRYYQLISSEKKFIPSEAQFAEIPNDIFENWLHQMFLERLELKADSVFEELKHTSNNWEAVLFRMLCKNFGLKLNGPSFLSIAKSFDYSIVRKCGDNTLKLEAILYGQAGFLDQDISSQYYELLQDSYAYAKIMYGISNEGVLPSKFFRLRPPNFPTLRLSQFAVLWTHKKFLFSKLMDAKTKEDYYDIFEVAASEYWDIHYNFGVESNKRKKSLTKNFMDLLIINTVIPLKFTYMKYMGEVVLDELTQLALSIKAEKNTIISKFKELRDFDDTAWHSQALLHLKSNYCTPFKCLQCEIGNYILKQ
ncbi:MAG: hypothetical protein CL596_05590 [Alteromonas sp.]|nr:hypothetical protein [Alteromonas sp.]MAY21580.1 hypothetical protein [Flavobacteriaceae bacterium]|tara:strand:- start:8365 stop:9636 length:1272 start_codon:yes stop_codon:yes gene_type:complete